MRFARNPLLILTVVAALTWTVFAQSTGSVTVARNVNLRPDPSTEYKEIRTLKPDEPAMTLLDPAPESGYYHVRTSAGEGGYVWSANVHVSTAPPASGGVSTLSATPITLGPGIPGSASMQGCGDGRWEHVYSPTRLLVQHDCVIITGVIMDATASQSTHEPDDVRHEADGDTHGWLKVDGPFTNLINAGNSSDEGGNLVFELVCHYTVTQADAKPGCAGFTDHTMIPAAGTHVAIKGTLVTEKNHAKWNEIHPVSSITIK